MIWETEDIGSLRRKLMIEKGENDSLSIERKEEIQIFFYKLMDLLISSIFRVWQPIEGQGLKNSSE